MPPLLRQRVFRLYWFAQSISMLGDQISGIALPLVGVITLHASPGQMGVLTALVWAPNLILALHAGALADRWGRRRWIMITADIGRALLLASVPVAAVLGALSMAQLYLVAFAAGSLSVFFQVSDSTLFVCVVRRDDYLAANSLVYGSRAASFMAGPSLGGILTQAVSAPAALLVDAASFLASAGFLSRISPTEPEPAAARAGAPDGGHPLYPADADPLLRARAQPPQSTSSTSRSSRCSCSTPSARCMSPQGRSESSSAWEPSAACWEPSSPAGSPTASASVRASSWDPCSSPCR